MKQKEKSKNKEQKKVSADSFDKYDSSTQKQQSSQKPKEIKPQEKAQISAKGNILDQAQEIKD